jgi:hypothetical protein
LYPVGMIDRLAWVWSIVVDSIDLWCDGFGIDVDDYRSIDCHRNPTISVFEVRSIAIGEYFYILLKLSIDYLIRETQQF